MTRARPTQRRGSVILIVLWAIGIADVMAETTQWFEAKS